MNQPRMFSFVSQLRASWITNKVQVGAWYYRQRFLRGALGRRECNADVKTPYSKTSVRIPLRERNDLFQLLSTFSSANTWNSLLVERAGVVVDLGANRGLSTLYWKLRFPDARVYGVEMDRENVQACEELFASNAQSAIFRETAIGPEEGVLSYRPHSSHTRNRLAQLCAAEEGDYSTDLVDVRSTTLAGFLRKESLERIDVLKVDIEGAEEFLLSSLDEWASAVAILLLEIHHNIDQEFARLRLLHAGFQITIGDSETRTEWWCVAHPESAQRLTTSRNAERPVGD